MFAAPRPATVLMSNALAYFNAWSWRLTAASCSRRSCSVASFPNGSTSGMRSSNATLNCCRSPPRSIRWRATSSPATGRSNAAINFSNAFSSIDLRRSSNALPRSLISSRSPFLVSLNSRFCSLCSSTSACIASRAAIWVRCTSMLGVPPGRRDGSVVRSNTSASAAFATRCPGTRRWAASIASSTAWVTAELMSVSESLMPSAKPRPMSRPMLRNTFDGDAVWVVARAPASAAEPRANPAA